jgi:hypothetical protein
MVLQYLGRNYIVEYKREQGDMLDFAPSQDVAPSLILRFLAQQTPHLWFLQGEE